ncbi:alkane 1-monooxygenase [Tahibacter amnicola]|uniref:Alkane 1-monooxygenase n=1 Tax=Tahibacter amnicola TaxID=2976241 RepID=A0ABY6BN00_9GAMM|nr:alkane 1-monooxygenase [Tahibacter amnicola]UXI69760.1 alkane 1-monooxygenase [Tahibacter amnicola]
MTREATRALGFCLVFVVPALLPVAEMMRRSGVPSVLAAAFPLFFLFVLVPLADALMGRDVRNPPGDDDATDASDWLFRGLTWLAVPAWLGLLGWALGVLANAPLGPGAKAVWLLSLGITGGVVAINTAHELIHKSGRFEPALGGVLLASVVYAGFKVEHLRGHHVHVSTPQDASSARLGESLYRFLPKALLSNALNAWRLEAARLRRLGLPAWHWRNELLGWYALSLLFAGAAFVFYGVAGLAGFLVQGAIAGVTLEIINYVEHYGLERRQVCPGQYERVDHRHSWNSSYRLTNWLLFQLQRHSDHHAHARRRYHRLRHHPDSPQLPAGYATMFLLALVPPLWRRTIDPRVHAWRARSAP